MIKGYHKSVIFVNQADEKEVLELLKAKKIEAETREFYSDHFFLSEVESILDSLIVNGEYDRLLELSDEDFERVVDDVANYITENKNEVVDTDYMEELVDNYLKENY